MKKTKACFKCHKTQPLTNFYAHSEMPDGHLGKCKECTKKDVQKNYRKNFEYYQEYEKKRRDLPHRVQGRLKYAASEEGRIAGNRAKKAWELRNPEKKHAAVALSNAVRDGKIVRKKTCEVCGRRKNVEAHHEDYSKPLEIKWLCKKCHWSADEKRREREQS